MSKYTNPFTIPAAESTVEDRMVALYSILHMHQAAKKAGVKLQLPLGKARFSMSNWLSVSPEKGASGNSCNTAACAAGSAALVPWFHDVAKSVGIKTYVRLHPSSRSEMVLPNFVDNPEIWGDAYDDMEQLFTGGMAVYDGIAAFDKDYDLGPELKDLTVRQVKSALKRIVRKHFGDEAVKRCEAMDRQSCDITQLQAAE